jgi:hypothetical protein
VRASLRPLFIGIGVVAALAGCSRGTGVQVDASGSSTTSTTTSEVGATTTVATATPSGAPTSTTSTTSTPSSLPFPTNTVIVIPSPVVPGPSFPSSGVPDAATGAVAITLTSGDNSAIGTAFAQWTSYEDPTECPVQPASTLDAAVISATGVEWAFGLMEPKPGCTVTEDGKTVNANTDSPFDAGVSESTGVFEKQPSGSWTMNSYESTPFPCPDKPGAAFNEPGPYRPYVPLAVLNAVGVSYASGCANMYTQPQPR